MDGYSKWKVWEIREVKEILSQKLEHTNDQKNGRNNMVSGSLRVPCRHSESHYSVLIYVMGTIINTEKES